MRLTGSPFAAPHRKLHALPQAPSQSVRFGSATETNTPGSCPQVPMAEVDTLIEQLTQRMQSAETVSEKARLTYESFPRITRLAGLYIPKTEGYGELGGELAHQIDNASTGFLLNYVLPAEDNGVAAPDFDQVFRERLLSCRQMVSNYNELVGSGLNTNTKRPGDIWMMVKKVLQPIAAAKDVKLNINGLPQLLMQVHGFANCSNARFYTLLMNLVQNAIKYTAEHSTVNINFSKEALPGTGTANKEEVPALRIQVSDEGIGIPQDEQKKVLQGNRASNALSSGIPGSGYGLSQVSGIVRYALGQLTIQSPLKPEKANPGTEITCWLPLE